MYDVLSVNANPYTFTFFFIITYERVFFPQTEMKTNYAELFLYLVNITK